MTFNSDLIYYILLSDPLMMVLLEIQKFNTPSKIFIASMDQRMREEIKKYQAINDGQRLQTIKSLAAE